MSKIWEGNKVPFIEPLPLVLEELKNCSVSQRKEKIDENFSAMAKIAIDGLNNFNKVIHNVYYLNNLVNLACQKSFETIAYGKRQDFKTAKNVYDNLGIIANELCDSKIIEKPKDNILGFLSQFGALGVFWGSILHNTFAEDSYAFFTDKKRDMGNKRKINKNGFDILARTGKKDKGTHYIQVKSSPNSKNWSRYERKIKIVTPSLIVGNHNSRLGYKKHQHPTAEIIRAIAENNEEKLFNFGNNLHNLLFKTNY